MKYMFHECYSLNELTIPNWNNENIICTDKMFSKCTDEFKMIIKKNFKNIRDEAFD